eukprot:UN3106
MHHALKTLVAPPVPAQRGTHKGKQKAYPSLRKCGRPSGRHRKSLERMGPPAPTFVARWANTSTCRLPRDGRLCTARRSATREQPWL